MNKRANKPQAVCIHSTHCTQSTARIGCRRDTTSLHRPCLLPRSVCISEALVQTVAYTGHIQYAKFPNATSSRIVVSCVHTVLSSKRAHFVVRTYFVPLHTSSLIGVHVDCQSQAKPSQATAVLWCLFSESN